MNQEKYQHIKNGAGFIAALDQSGGSSAGTLASYGITKDSYFGQEEMFALIHQMRERIIKNPNFSGDFVLGVILFEKTMQGKIGDQYISDYLWDQKNIVSFLKIDQGLAELANGVQLMKPIPNLNDMLQEALDKNIFGTKMRSVIKSDNAEGIKLIVDQQFELAKQIWAKGLVPIIEPEVDIQAENKEKCEELLKAEIDQHLATLSDEKIMLKLTLPSQNNFYQEYTQHPNVVRVLALSGGYPQETANLKLAKNEGVIASFSRALLEDLNINQSEAEFGECLLNSVKSIYAASVEK